MAILLPHCEALDPLSVFPTHDPSAQFLFSAEEEKVLKYWKDINAFAESLKQSEGREPFSFYDGTFSTFRHRNAPLDRQLIVFPLFLV
jgi:hypothetical protein